MSHSELSLHCTENCNFWWMFFLSSAFLFRDIICPGAHQNTPLISILVCLSEETKMCWLLLVTLLFHFPPLIAWLLKQWKCCNSALQSSPQSNRNIYTDILVFIIPTSVSQRGSVGSLLTTMWLISLKYSTKYSTITAVGRVVRMASSLLSLLCFLAQHISTWISCLSGNNGHMKNSTCLFLPGLWS